MNWVKEDLLWAFLIGLIWLVQKLWRYRETIARMFSAGSEEETADAFPFDPQAVRELKETLRRRAAATPSEFEIDGEPAATPEDEFEAGPMEAEAQEVPPPTTVPTAARPAATPTVTPTAAGAPVAVHPIVAALRRHPQAGIVLAEILGPPRGLR